MMTIYQFFFYLDWNTYVFNIKLEDFFHECRQTCQQSIVSPVVAHVRSQTGPYSRRHCNGFPRCLQCLIWRKCSQATSLQMFFENYLVFFLFLFNWFSLEFRFFIQLMHLISLWTINDLDKPREYPNIGVVFNRRSNVLSLRLCNPGVLVWGIGCYVKPRTNPQKCETTYQQNRSHIQWRRYHVTRSIRHKMRYCSDSRSESCARDTRFWSTHLCNEY